MLNNVVLIGRLTRDPELRYTQGGNVAVASFTLAVNRPYTTQNGTREADFINCVIWRKPAETLTQYTHKGSLLAVQGRIQTRSYENQQGNRVYVTEVVVENFSFLETRSQADQYRQQHPNSGTSSQQSSPMPDPFAGNEIPNPFGGQVTNGSMPVNDTHTDSSDPFANNGGDVDISDDDLPF